MSEEVIQQVAAIATAKRQPDTFTFVYRNGNTPKPNIMHHITDLTGVDGEEIEISDPETQDPQQRFEEEQEHLEQEQLQIQCQEEQQQLDQGQKFINQDENIFHDSQEVPMGH